MNKLLSALLSITLLVSIIGCGNDDDGPVQPVNNPPVFLSLTASPDTVLPGEKVGLFCLAADEDNDMLTYVWNAAEGEIINDDHKAVVNWIAPESDGNYEIQVIVTDGEEIAGGSVDVVVNNDGTTGVTGFDIGSTGLQVQMVWIPAGSFEMGGAPDDTLQIEADEYPIHTVTIANGFWMGKFEVTQEQWQMVMDDNPSYFKHDMHPVEEVSWEDVEIFLDSLNTWEGEDRWRLPSESEWEYACRAGSSTMFTWGEDTGFVHLPDYAVYGAYNYVGSHAEVGSRLPNPWGLHDVYGNVWEWVEDKYHNDYDGAPDDGSAWTSGSTRNKVIRGGSWTDFPGSLRSSSRHQANKETRFQNIGFRLVRASE